MGKNRDLFKKIRDTKGTFLEKMGSIKDRNGMDSNPKERQYQRMLKLPHNSTHPHVTKVMLKILQARLQQYVNCELPDAQVGFRKGRGTRDQIANICWIMEKAREFQKIIYFVLFTMLKPLTVWITINCGKFLKRWK